MGRGLALAPGQGVLRTAVDQAGQRGACALCGAEPSPSCPLNPPPLSAQNNRKSPGMDINVTGVWERNVTGQGVTVVVVDDGVEHTVQDIQPNYVSSRCQAALGGASGP